MNSGRRSRDGWTSVGVHHWFGGHDRHRGRPATFGRVDPDGTVFVLRRCDRVARWLRALPDRPGRVAAVTATDRKLRRLIAAAAPFRAPGEPRVRGAGSGSWLRLVINGAVCGTDIATGLLAWSRRPANRTGRFMVGRSDCSSSSTAPGRHAAAADPGREARGDDRVGHPARRSDPGVPVGTLRSNVDRAFPGGRRGGVALRQSGRPSRATTRARRAAVSTTRTC